MKTYPTVTQPALLRAASSIMKGFPKPSISYDGFLRFAGVDNFSKISLYSFWLNLFLLLLGAHGNPLAIAVAAF
jgi:hypothetical protein